MTRVGSAPGVSLRLLPQLATTCESAFGVPMASPLGKPFNPHLPGRPVPNTLDEWQAQDFG